MTVIKIPPKTPKEIDQRTLRLLVFAFISDHVDAKGLFSHGDKFVANALLDGSEADRKKISRVIDWLEQKEYVSIIQHDRFKPGAGSEPDILKPIPAALFWQKEWQNTLVDKTREMSIRKSDGQKGSVKQSQVAKDSNTSLVDKKLPKKDSEGVDMSTIHSTTVGSGYCVSVEDSKQYAVCSSKMSTSESTGYTNQPEPIPYEALPICRGCGINKVAGTFNREWGAEYCSKECSRRQS